MTAWRWAQDLYLSLGVVWFACMAFCHWLGDTPEWHRFRRDAPRDPLGAASAIVGVVVTWPWWAAHWCRAVRRGHQG